MYVTGGVRSRKGKTRYYVKKNGVKIATGFRSRTSAVRWAKAHFNRTFKGGRVGRGRRRRVRRHKRRKSHRRKKR